MSTPVTRAYTEGPTDQTWEVERAKQGVYFVQRHDFNARGIDTERLYVVTDPYDAQQLANELNELDRLRRIEALALAWHNAILATNGVYDAEQALRAALQPQEPTQ